MGDRLRRLYHALPPTLRSAAATLQGCRLRWWRYGRETERLVSEALERDRWPAERLTAWQEERLAFLLDRAATRVPFYRAHWSERRRRGDRASWERLEHWPVLGKDSLRANPRAFVADDCSVRLMFEVNTSGTTGKPLRLWRSRATSRAYYALLEARYRRWNGVSWRDQCWAVLGGQVVTPPNARRPPFWVWNAAMHELYLSANHVSRRNVAAFVSALAEYCPTHLVAYASSAAALANECLEAGLDYDGFKVVATGAEPLRPWQRDVIARAFRTPVRETYGMVEIVAGASECAHGALHVWPEMGAVEVLEDDADVAAVPGASGRLVCTGLLNADMPLIRYVVGDRGGLATGEGRCACGRTLPVLRGIEGRSNDLLIAPDGRRVYWLNPVFYGLPIHEAQIVQERLDEVRVRYVPVASFNEASGNLIIERLRSRMGEVEVRLEAVPEIPRGPNGKFQAVVCKLDQRCLGGPNTLGAG
jgi:phenylacetate-CoA ligase